MEKNQIINEEASYASYSLFYKNSHQLRIPESLAAIVGLAAAALIEVVDRWCESNERCQKSDYYRDGYWWTKGTYNYWANIAPYLGSKSTIRRLCKELEASKFLISIQDCYDPGGKWYRIDRIAVGRTLLESQYALEAVEPEPLPNMNRGGVQNEQVNNSLINNTSDEKKEDENLVLENMASNIEIEDLAKPELSEKDKFLWNEPQRYKKNTQEWHEFMLEGLLTWNPTYFTFKEGPLVGQINRIHARNYLNKLFFTARNNLDDAGEKSFILLEDLRSLGLAIEESKNQPGQKFDDESYQRFWEAYPIKLKYYLGLNAWKRLNRDDEAIKFGVDGILASLEIQCRRANRDSNSIYSRLPAPDTWLDTRRYLDIAIDDRTCARNSGMSFAEYSMEDHLRLGNEYVSNPDEFIKVLHHREWIGYVAQNFDDPDEFWKNLQKQQQLVKT